MALAINATSIIWLTKPETSQAGWDSLSAKSIYIAVFGAVLCWIQKQVILRLPAKKVAEFYRGYDSHKIQKEVTVYDRTIPAMIFLAVFVEGFIFSMYKSIDGELYETWLKLSETGAIIAPPFISTMCIISIAFQSQVKRIAVNKIEEAKGTYPLPYGGPYSKY